MDVKRIIWILLPTILVLLFVVNGFSPREQEKHEVQRGYEPWAFRSVLDWRARILTLALRDDFWVAYDAEKASIYKIWQDGVEFDGPVYTTAHGPQPISRGPAWMQSPFVQPWTITQNGESYTPEVQFRGHTFLDHGIRLSYQLILRDGRRIDIDEFPEYLPHEKGHKGLERIFITRGVPQNMSISMKSHLNSLISEQGYRTDGEFEVDSSFTHILPGKQAHEVYGSLRLNNNGKTSFVAWMYGEPLLQSSEEESENEEITEHPGKALVARSDCQTCHNEKQKAIGPAYVSIAERYTYTDYFVSKLANKIVNGGAGVWGEAAMTAHPGLPLADAKEMVSYIMTLDGEAAPKGGNSAAKSQKGSPIFQASKTGESGKGAIVQTYKLPKSIASLDEMDRSSLPHYVGRVSAINAVNPEDFADPNQQLDLTTDLYLEFNAYLDLPKSDNYLFRLISDDGARLYIDDRKVVDHDGLHGYKAQDGEIALDAGKHRLKVEFFQAGGGKGISLFYLKHGEEEFSLVDASMLSYDSTHLSKTRPYVPVEKIQKSIPGDRTALKEVHPSFDLENFRPEGFQPRVGGMDFLSDGRLVLSTWDSEGSVYLLDQVVGNTDPNKVSIKKIASGLAEPLGLKVVNDTIYVLQKQELTRLTDLDGDDMIDQYYTLCNSWDVSSNFHEFSFGLAYKEGHFYGALATAIEPGGKSTYPQIQDRGRAVKINKSNGSLSFIAHGFRTPNGVGKALGDQIFVADNQGDWLPASKIVHLKEGGFYGSRSVNFEKTEGLPVKLPVVWLPQDEIGNSPSQPIPMEFGPYKGQLLHGEVTHGGLKRSFLEKVDGAYQGCVFRFTQGLEAGVNRATYGPDGALYVGGIGNPGNWAQEGKEWHGLQRLVYNGKTTFEMLAVRARSNGMEIEFTEPLSHMDGFDPGDYEVLQWYYRPTKNYGGPKLNIKPLPIRSVNVSRDRKKVFLELGGMKEEHLVYIRLKKPFISAGGNELWSTEAWYTLNKIPKNCPGFLSDLQPPPLLPNTLTEYERRQGWRLLFDGVSFKGWKGFKIDKIGVSWKIRDNAMVLLRDPDSDHVLDGGDLLTDQPYENFELSLEWKIKQGSNSGIFYMVQDEEPYESTWQTALEMQVLDNVYHPDGSFDKHRAGDLYDLVESKYVAVNPPGEWNKVRIIHDHGHIEHWLNGRKVVEVDMNTPAWQELIQASKFKNMEGFAKKALGHIALQDHGDEVWYRNIKIKSLEKDS